VTTPTPTDEGKSLGRLLLELLWQLIVLLVPVFLVTILPPFAALLAVLACAGAMWLAAKLGSPDSARFIARLMCGAAFGLGFSVGRALPGYWGIFAAMLTMAAGLASVAMWEKRLGLAKAEPVKSSGGGSAWGGDEPSVTPEGQPIRTFNHSEIAMGGPTYCDYLFSDGVLLQGLGSSARFSSDGRYFAAPIPSRSSWKLMIFDRTARRIYICDNDQFWELDEFDEQGLSGRVSPLVENSPRKTPLEELLQGAEAVDLIAIGDLWLEPGSWQEQMAREHVEYPPPRGELNVEGHIFLPPDLRALPDPVAPLRYPEYRLSINGVQSPMLVRADSPLIWHPHGSQFACIAHSDEADSGGYWLFGNDRGWRKLSDAWIKQDNEPSLNWHEPLALDDQHLWIDAYLDYPQPDNGRYGYGLYSIHSDTETEIGHTPRGRIVVGERPLTRVRLAMPLHTGLKRGSSRVESLPLKSQQRAWLEWQSDNSEGVGAYCCRIGDWQLPGLWLLDHRVSDCGGFLALLPFSEPPAVTGHAVVVDLHARTLLQGAPLLVARILDFRAGKLTVAAIRGRLSRDYATSPLRRFDQPAPDAANAAGFCRYRDDSQLYYQSVELQVEAGYLRQLPPWRRVEQPQAAVADGDFVQVAPGNRDAAWLFGCETEYATSWLRAQSLRLNGFLLTASGCAVQGLSPSMAWSPAGRYLALTSFIPDNYDPYTLGQDTWRLLLLDVQERSLRYYPSYLDSRPEFLGFDHDKLRIKLFEQDWEPEDQPDPFRTLTIPLDELLALDSVPLVAQNGIWLQHTHVHWEPLWQALDAAALAPWRSQ
jgi:hypothetical protein